MKTQEMQRRYLKTSRVLGLPITVSLYLLAVQLASASDNCQETGPHYYSWVDVCPAVNNSPAVTPTTLCGEINTAPPQPTVTAPTFSAGTAETYTWYDCNTNTSDTVWQFNYSVSSVQWDSPLPATFGLTNVPSFSSTAYVTIALDPVEFCLVCYCGRFDIGSATWNVADTNIYAPYPATFDFNKLSNYFATLLSTASKATSVAGCSVGSPTFSGEITLNRWQKCCSSTDGPYMHSSVDGTISVGWPQTDCPIPGVSLSVPGGYASIGLYITFGANASTTGTGVSSPCTTEPVIVTFHLDANFGPKVGAEIKLPDGLLSCEISASGTASASVDMSCQDPTQNKGTRTLNLGKLQVTVVATLEALDGSIKCTAYSGTWTLWDGLTQSWDSSCVTL